MEQAKKLISGLLWQRDNRGRVPQLGHSVGVQHAPEAGEGEVEAAPACKGGFNLVGNWVPVRGRRQVVADLNAEVLGRDGGKGPRDVENFRKSFGIAVKDDPGRLAPVHRCP